MNIKEVERMKTTERRIKQPTLVAWVWISGVVMLLLFGLTTLAQAEEGKVSALAPWQGEGHVYKVEPGKLLFLGRFDGIMYIETGKGTLNAALMVCPVTQEMDLRANTTSATGRCIMKNSDGHFVFAKWNCSGKPGGCEGDFILTSGTGRFKGITGSGRFRVRSVLQGLAKNVKTGEIIRGAAGLAVWKDLKYTIPPK